MEEMDFSSLTARYSTKGRNGYNPIMMYALVTYANMRGVCSVDRIVELCERDLAFIWLAKGQRPKRDAFYDFKGEKLTPEILDDLHYQFLRRLEKEGLITLKELFIDGTKIAQMFIIEGMDKVREVIEKNRSRKLTKHKKLSNNTLIESDSCSPLELLKLQTNLTKIANAEGISFVTEKGKRKPQIQQLYEELEECGERLM